MSIVKGQKSKVLGHRIYLDYAATTPLDKRVKGAMEPFFSEKFGNPSSIHLEGVAGEKALDSARTTVARCLEVHPEEIVFTSGGTEANNLAVFGVCKGVCRSLTPTNATGKTVGVKLLQENRYDRSYFLQRKPHVVTTNIEHASMLEPLRELERRGEAEVTYVSVEPNGIVKAEKIIAAILPNTVLVSVMYANNEIGTIQPIFKIGKLIRDLKDRPKSQIPNSKFCPYGTFHKVRQTNPKFQTPIFHVDGCQAPLYLHCLVNALGVDLMTLDAHKIYGPKGVGALYVRRNTPLAAHLLGGGQERGLRSTTENIPGIVGFAEALRIAVAEREKESSRLEKLRNRLYFNILQNTEIKKKKEIIVNGSMKEEERLPNNLNISFPGVDTEFLTLKLDTAGIACSTKSSCLKDERESYVVKALGKDAKRAGSTLRFTFGRGTRNSDIKFVVRALARLL